MKPSQHRSLSAGTAPASPPVTPRPALVRENRARCDPWGRNSRKRLDGNRGLSTLKRDAISRSRTARIDAQASQGPGRAAGRPPRGSPGSPGRAVVGVVARRDQPRYGGGRGRRSSASAPGRPSRSRDVARARPSGVGGRRRRSGAPRDDRRPGGSRPAGTTSTHRVAAAAGGHPPPAADLVRELVQREVRRPLAVDAERQVRERVARVGVAAVLGHQDVGRELAQQRRARPRGRRAASRRRRCRAAGHVDRACPRRPGPPTSLREAGAGEQRPAALVQRDGQHPRVVAEDLPRRRRRGGRRRRRRPPAARRWSSSQRIATATSL